MPNTREARARAEELRTYEIRVSEDANDRYGTFMTGAHDDLTTALGLTVIEVRDRLAKAFVQAVDLFLRTESGGSPSDSAIPPAQRPGATGTGR